MSACECVRYLGTRDIGTGQKGALVGLNEPLAV